MKWGMYLGHSIEYNCKTGTVVGLGVFISSVSKYECWDYFNH